MFKICIVFKISIRRDGGLSVPEKEKGRMSYLSVYKERSKKTLVAFMH